MVAVIRAAAGRGRGPRDGRQRRRRVSTKMPGSVHEVDHGGMEVLGSRILLRPIDLGRSHRFYRDTLGLAIYREFGGEDAPGLVFFLGNGLLEVSGQATDPAGDALGMWLQVRDVRAEHRPGQGGRGGPEGAATRGLGPRGDVDRRPGRSAYRPCRDPGGPSTPPGPTPPRCWRRMSRPHRRAARGRCVALAPEAAPRLDAEDAAGECGRGRVRSAVAPYMNFKPK